LNFNDNHGDAAHDHHRRHDQTPGQGFAQEEPAQPLLPVRRVLGSSRRDLCRSRLERAALPCMRQHVELAVFIDGLSAARQLGAGARGVA
jgi:hypothetical protein